MSETEEVREPLDVLAEEFMERQRSGEMPSIAEYTSKHPELAADIEELFPAIAVVERLKVHKQQESNPRISLGGVRMERLGDFLIIGEIGRGGMGIVYEAFQESLGRHVAVKVLPRSSLLDEKRLRRFHREAQTAAKLHHTNIVPIFGVGEHDGYHYIVMQLIRGVGLDSIIAELRRLNASAFQSDTEKHEAATTEASRLAAALAEGRVWDSREFDTRNDSSIVERSLSKGGKGESQNSDLSASTVTQSFKASSSISSAPSRCGVAKPSSESSNPSNSAETASLPPLRFGASYWRGVATIGMQVADALHYAHGHNTLHRDIKPANLLLDSKGVVWITDFGLAKAMEQDNVTQDGDMVGTLRYMAPEQFCGQADARSDIYNLGITLYEMLVARPAFEGTDRNGLMHRILHVRPTSPRKLNPEIPRDLETIVLKAIALDPRDRYRTAGEMAGDLRCFLDDRPIRARRASLPERVWRWSRRNRAVAFLTASSLLMLFAIAVLASVGYLRTTQANLEEKRLRKKSDDTSALAVQALDSIFRQFAPDRAATASSMMIVGDSGEEITVSAQPVLSKEAAAILERMLVFYDRLAKQDGDDGRLREKVAEANRRVGDIRQRLGQYEESQMAYSHAAALYEKLCESSVIDSHFKAEIARIYNELGNVQGAMNRVKEGRDAYRQAQTILEQLVADSSSPELRFELARTFYFLGKGPSGQHGPPPMMLGGPRGPRPDSPHNPLDFGFAFGMPDFGPPELDDFESLGPDDGGPPEPRDDGGPTPMEFIFGFPGPFQGPPDGPFGPEGPDRDFGPPFGGENRRKMGEYLTKAVDILRRLIAEHPDVPDYRQLLARCYREISQEPFGRGSTSMPDAAKESVKILAKLVEKYPNVSDYRYDLSEAYLALATNDWRTPSKSRDEKSKLESQELLEKALAISEDLVAENPNIPDYAVALAQLRLRLAFTLSSDEKQTESAEQYFRKAIDSQAALVRRFPHVSNYKFGLAFAEDTFAVFLKRQKRLPEAQAALRESIDSMKEAMQSDSRAHFIRGILDRNYSILADMLRQSGDEQGAAEAERQVELLRSER